MRAITFKQPDAQLIALRAKRYATFTWYTNYRGPLAIHASLEFPESARRLCRCEPFSTALLGNEDLPLGCVVAICDLTAVVPTSPQEESLFGEVSNDFPESEQPFGDFSPGRYAWHLTNVRALENPIPARGSQSLWEWDEGQLGLLDQPQPIHHSNMKKKKTAPTQYRQGDVLIERVDSLPKLTGKPKIENGRVILAHGEVTGHAHEIESPQLASLREMKEAVRLLGDTDGAEAMTQAGLMLTQDTGVIHQEHARIALPSGTYVVRRQREYSPEAIRNVAD
jgi:hypothetical protein